jgi:hypothetical protein
MTVHGVKVDRPLKDKIAEDMKNDIGILRARYYEQVAACTGEPEYRPNPN